MHLHRRNVANCVEHNWYLRAAKTEAEEAGLSTDGMAESTAKLREELLKLTGNKLDIQIDEHNFKSSFQILKELSEIWDEIGDKAGDVSQANILNLLGGKRNANVLASIITNFKDAIDAAETAGDSMGSAWAENEKYLGSIEGKTKQCEAAFQTFANQVLTSGVVKAFIDMQTAVLNLATDLSKLGALIPTLAAIAATVNAVKTAFAARKTTDTILSMIVGGDGDINGAIKQLTGLTKLQRQMVANNLEVAVSTGSVSGATALGAKEMAGYAASMNVATASTTGFKTALEGVKAAFMSNPLGLALIAIAGGIAMIKKGIDSMHEAAEAAIQQADDIQAAYDQSNKEYEQNIESLNNLRDRFDELNKKVGENGTQGALTTDEYKEYMDIVKQIITISPGLANHYTNVGEAIEGGYVTALQDAIEYQKQLLKYENDTYLSGGDKLFAGFTAKFRQIRDDMDDLNNGLYSVISDIVLENALKNADFNIDSFADTMAKITEAFQMADGTALWDAKPTLSNLEEMLGYYENMEDMLDGLRQMTKEVSTESGDLLQVPMFSDSEINDIKQAMRQYADSAKQFAEVKQEAFQYLYTYFQTDLNNLYEQIPLDRISEFKTLMADAIVPTATLDSNKRIVQSFANAYIEALGDMKSAAAADDPSSMMEALRVKYAAFPSLFDMIVKGVEKLTSAQGEAGESAEQTAKTYDELADAMSNLEKAVSFLNAARNAGDQDILSMIKQAQEFTAMMQEAGKDVEVDNLFIPQEDGTLQWNIDKVEELVEEYIRLAFAGTDLANTYPDVVDWIVQQAMAAEKAAEETKTLGDSISDLSNTFALIKDISSYQAGEKDILDMIESVYEYAKSHEGISLGDLVKWDASGLDFQMDAAQKMLESRATEISGAITEALFNAGKITEEEIYTVQQNIKQALMNGADGVEEEAETIATAMTQISDAFSYMNDKDAYQEGEKNLFEMLESAYSYAEKYGKDIKDLISLEGTDIIFKDFTDDTLDGFIRNLADKLGVGDEAFNDFSNKIKESFAEAEEAVRTLQDAFDELNQSMSFLSDIESFGEGEKSVLEMLEQAYKFAEQYEGVNLADLIGWDGKQLSFEADAVQKIIESRATEISGAVAEALFNAGKITEEQIYDTQQAVKAAVMERGAEIEETVVEEAETIGDAMQKIADAFAYMKDLESYRSGETSMFDMLEKAYNLAEKYDTIDLGDLVTVEGAEVAFNDFNDVVLEGFIRALAEKLKVAEADFEQFAQNVRESFAEAEEGVRSLEDAVGELAAAMSYLNDHPNGSAVESGSMLEELEKFYSLRQQMGKEDEWDILDFFDWDGTDFINKTDALAKIAEDNAREIANAFTTALVLAGKITAAEVGDTYLLIKEKLLQGKDVSEETEEEAETIGNALKKVADAFAYMKDLESYKSGETSLFDMLEKAYNLAEKYDAINLTDLVNVEGAEVTFNDFNDVVLEGFIRALAEKLGVAEGDFEQFAQNVRDSFAEAETGVRTLENAVTDLANAMSYLNDHENGSVIGSGSMLDELQKFYSLRQQMGKEDEWDLLDFFSWDGTDFSNKTAALTAVVNENAREIASAFTEALFNAGQISEEEISDTYLRIKEILLQGKEEITSAYEALTDTIGKVKTAKSFNDMVDSYKSGDTGFIDMLESSIETADKLGLTLEEVFDFESMQPSAEAVLVAIDKIIDDFIEGSDYSQEFAEQLKEAARNAVEVESAISKIEGRFESFTSMTGNLSSVGRTAQLTYDTYKNMIEQDARYANSIEYVNGQLTVNKQKYLEITQAIGQETAALAQQRIAQIKSSEEYINYVNEFEQYGDQMDASHLKALQNLELEIRGYEVLTSEINAASDAIRAFGNASDETSGPNYKNVKSAKQIIEDTLKNKDSDRYGKVGLEKYQLAYDIILGGKVDVNTSALDAALEKVNRYLTDDKTGYNNFVKDLMTAGIVDASGSFNSTVDEMAEKLGVTKDLVRAMLEEAETYGSKIDWSKIDPKSAEESAKKTKSIFDTISDVGKAIDELKNNKMDIGAGEAAEGVSSVNDNLGQTSALLDEIKGKGGLNGALFGSNGGMPSGGKRQLGNDYVPDWYDGNVDLLSRNIIPAKMMIEVGWEFEDDSYATLFSSAMSGDDFGIEGPEANLIVSVTPITPDGNTVLSPEQLSDYIYELLTDSQNTGKSVKELDAERLNLVLDVDTKGAEESFDEAYARIDAKMIELHELQAEWDQLRLQFNFFGEDKDPHGVFDGVEEGADEAKEHIEGLSDTPVENDTSKSITNINGVTTAADNATNAVKKLDGQKAEVTIDLKTTGGGDKPKTLWELLGLGGVAAANGMSRSTRGGKILVGELGREIVVDTESGEWYTVGDNGPEIVNVPKNGIVFNNADTERILRKRKTGKRTGGRAYTTGGVVGNGLLDGLGGLLGGLVDGIQEFFEDLPELIEGLGDVVGGVLEGFDDEGGDKPQGGGDKIKTLQQQLEELKEAYEELNAEYDHYLKHLEYEYYLNERAHDYKGMEETLQKQAEYYQKLYDEALKAIEAMKALGATDTDEELQAMEEAAWDAYKSMMEAFDSIRDLYKNALNEEIDALQSAFSNFKSIIEQYNDTGTITMDMFQQIIENGLQYLQFLEMEDGQLVLNEESLRKMLQARKEQLAIESAVSYLDRIREAAQLGETERLKELIDATETLGKSTWDLVYAQLAAMKAEGLISDEQYDKILETIERLRELSKITDEDLSIGEGEEDDRIAKIREEYEELIDAIDHYIEHLKQAQTTAEHALDYDAVSESLQAQIEQYLEQRRQLLLAIGEMVREGADDTNEDLQALEEQLWDIDQTLWDLQDQLINLRTDAITDALNSMKSAIGDLQEAMNQLNENGEISLDTLMSILQNGLQYLQYIEIENGKIKLNREAIQEMIKAQKEQLAIETALAYLAKIQAAIDNNEPERLKLLIGLTNDLGSSTWDLVYAQVALMEQSGELTMKEAEAIREYLDKLRELADMTDTDILDTVEETLEDKLQKILEDFDAIRDRMDHYIAHLEQEFKESERATDFDDMDAILRKEIEYYQYIYDQAMEALAKMKEQGAKDSDEARQQVEEEAWKAWEAMEEAFQRLNSLKTDALKEALDGLTQAYGNLDKVAQEYNKNGKITLSSYEALLEGGLQYLQYLDKEGKRYVLNEQALQDMMKARAQQLAVESALAHIAQIKHALENGELETVKMLIDASQEVTKHTWNYVFAQAALLKTMGLTDEQYDQLIDSLKTAQELSTQIDFDLGTGEEINRIEELADVFDRVNKQLGHLIEHLNQDFWKAERFGDIGAMATTLGEQIKYYTEIRDSAKHYIDEMKREGADDTDENLQALEQSYWDAEQNIAEALDKLRDLRVDALNDQIDGMTDAAETLRDAAASLNESGTLSLDTFQELLKNGMEYLRFLDLEDGQYVLNKDAVYDYIQAKSQQLAVETALNQIDMIKEALQAGELGRVEALITANQEVTESTWALVDARLAELLAMKEQYGLSDELYGMLVENIHKLHKISENVSYGLDEEAPDKIREAADAFSELSDELDHYIKHQDQAYKHAEHAKDYDGMLTALERKMGYYAQVIENANDTLAKMAEEGADDTTKAYQEVEEAMWSAMDSLQELNEQMLSLRMDALRESLNSLTGAYGDLKNAADEYNENGGITLSTFQSILENGVEYLSILEKEGSEYVISKDKLNAYVAAQKEQLAIETALNYVKSIKAAIDNDEMNRVDQLITGMHTISNATWDMVYAQIALLDTSKLTNEQLDEIYGNVDKIRTMSDNVITDLTAGESDIADQYTKQEESLDKILEYTKDLIRAEAKERVEAIKKEVDEYRKLIDLKKKELEMDRDESDYQDEVAKMVGEIADLQAKADMLALDPSREAQNKRMEILQQIEDKQNELSKKQADYAYDATINSLNAQADAYEEGRQAEIDQIEASVSSEEKVYQLAIERIRTQWETLYADLIAWNTEQGSVINQEITDAWESATLAVERYGSVIAALNREGVTTEGGNPLAVASEFPGGVSLAGTRGGAANQSGLSGLANVSDRQMQEMYTAIDFMSYLGDKLGTSFSGMGSVYDLTAAMQSSPSAVDTAKIATALADSHNISNFEPVFNVTISGTDLNEQNARRVGELVAQSAADNLYRTFVQRGIGNLQTLRQ